MASRSYRVLSIDGGGMRGLYSCAYLQGLAGIGKKRFGVDIDDIGRKFDLIVGTSTGAIIGAGLAAGIRLDDICALYVEHGPAIFPDRLPDSVWKLPFHNRSETNRQGDLGLRAALSETFKSTTLAQLYAERGIALAITAVNCASHRAYVFKTPHDASSSHRDDEVTLADACLASSAAPIYRSIAVINQTDSAPDDTMFIDGGLWANNPVMVALIEALRNTTPEHSIEIYSLGTSPAPAGSVLDPVSPHWGLREWKFGGRAVDYALDSQTVVHDQMARMLLDHLDREVSITRFPQPAPSAEQASLLALDDASRESMDLLRQLASTAVDMTNQLMNRKGDKEGLRIATLIGDESNVRGTDDV